MQNEQRHIKVKGLSFIEFSGDHPEKLTSLFEKMGLTAASHRHSNNSTFHHQGDIHFISNPSIGGNAEAFRATHQRGACAMGFKVDDAAKAYTLALELGAIAADKKDYDAPAIKGVGKSLIYLVDTNIEEKIFADFNYQRTSSKSGITHLNRVDHLTHNLNSGGIKRVGGFYQRVFGFRPVRSFDIEGKKTGLYSEVMASSGGEVIIPLNESKDDQSQIAEFIRDYHGEGIQHIALATHDIVQSVDTLRERGIVFQDTPDTYYELVNERLPGHDEPLEDLRRRKILIDGGEAQGGGYLLQIFTQNSIGPIFFEYIQRKGNKGFGEGNFQALFESIELDQERRGVLK